MDTPIFNEVAKRLGLAVAPVTAWDGSITATRRKAIKRIQDRVVREALKEAQESDGAA